MSVTAELPTVVSIPRNSGRFVARLLIGVLVYAQLALAAYACPAMPADVPGAPMMDGAVMEPVATASIDGAPHAGSLDAAQPNLCVAHCRSGQQNVDAKPAPSPPVALPTGHDRPQPVAQGDRPARPFGPAAGAPPPADPPHAILHCCYRI